MPRRGGSAPVDDRQPTFVIIDEAHNFVPDTPINTLQEQVSNRIAAIAAEGRKYGLFLVLATQRPSKLRKGLLSECENASLLKIQSKAERIHAAEVLGIPAETVEQISTFPPGTALLHTRTLGARFLDCSVGSGENADRRQRNKTSRVGWKIITDAAGSRNVGRRGAREPLSHCLCGGRDDPSSAAHHFVLRRARDTSAAPARPALYPYSNNSSPKDSLLNFCGGVTLASRPSGVKSIRFQYGYTVSTWLCGNSVAEKWKMSPRAGCEDKHHRPLHVVKPSPSATFVLYATHEHKIRRTPRQSPAGAGCRDPESQKGRTARERQVSKQAARRAAPRRQGPDAPAIGRLTRTIFVMADYRSASY